jgi:hypothetical protein
MTLNVGNTDRIVRTILGAVLIGATVSGLIGGWGWLGVVLLATAAFSYCPIYAVLGTSS